jgi:hypothetical protein
MCRLLETSVPPGHCNSLSGFENDKRIAAFLKILSKRSIIVSTLTFELMQYVMEDIKCLPLFVLCYNTNSIQQSLTEVIMSNIPIHILRKIYRTVVSSEQDNCCFHNPYTILMP